MRNVICIWFRILWILTKSSRNWPESHAHFVFDATKNCSALWLVSQSKYSSWMLAAALTAAKKKKKKIGNWMHTDSSSCTKCIEQWQWSCVCICSMCVFVVVSAVASDLLTSLFLQNSYKFFVEFMALLPKKIKKKIWSCDDIWSLLSFSFSIHTERRARQDCVHWWRCSFLELQIIHTWICRKHFFFLHLFHANNLWLVVVFVAFFFCLGISSAMAPTRFIVLGALIVRLWHRGNAIRDTL